MNKDGALLMNISKYMAFVAAVEYGSFTKAGDMLSYSQSAVSKMINDLEDEWKISILERSKSGVKLTSDGLKIFPYAKSVCEEYEKLQMQIDELNGLQSGLIRIGTFSSVATHWLPNIIKEFQKDYPNIDYELLLGDYTEIENWISEGRVDCGFCVFQPVLNLTRYIWKATGFWLYCLKIMSYPGTKMSRSQLFAKSLLCFWKRAQKPKYRRYLKIMI